ncbi:nucleotidyltransferase domain-containing protein [Candidatus Woesearchaeota archaeon]|nr:nucleotidyltransferase domain-containing protein [Candidatus Woesearchaeota archaeon]
MIQNERIRLLNAWRNNLFAEFSRAEVMKITRKRSKPWVFNSLRELVKKSLLQSRRKANLDLYSLDLGNPLLIHTLQYIESLDLLAFPQLDIIKEAITKIPQKNYCLLVFGSYAANDQKKGSDIDICFLVENEITAKKIKPYFNEIKLSHAIEIDEHYVTFDDFTEMLLREEENLGKQIFRKSRIFFNPDIYYQLIREAHKNGFRQ